MKIVSKSFNGTVIKTVELTYDHENRLVHKAVTQSSTTTETFFAYDNNQIALTMDDEGEVQNRLLWGPGVDQALADESFVSEPATYWHLADHQGSVRDMIWYDDSDGETETVYHVAYNAFGLRTGFWGSEVVPINYTGKYLDPDTGLQWHQHEGSVGRWYNPAIGQWMSQDPIGFEAEDANLYRYVGNSPTNATDPLGLKGVPFDSTRCAEAEPTSDKSVCSKHNYVLSGMKADCICVCAGDSPWDNFVRGCLSCAHDAGVDPAEAHRRCYDLADAKYGRLAGILAMIDIALCGFSCSEEGPVDWSCGLGPYN